LPHKRFVSPVLQGKAQDFLGSETSTYRTRCQAQGRWLVYDDRQDDPLAKAGAALAPSTLWRWLSWLADGLPNTFRAARQLIREKEPESVLHREGWAVAPRHYRSEARRQVLQRALEAIVVERVFQRRFGKAIFPNFATAHGWS
jgi:hypothetical protein